MTANQPGQRATQGADHCRRIIMVAGYAIHRNAERGEHLAKSRVAIGVVLHQIAGREDAVTGPMTGARVLDYGEKRRVRCDTAQLAVGITIQMRVRELYETHAAHFGASTWVRRPHAERGTGHISAADDIRGFAASRVMQVACNWAIQLRCEARIAASVTQGTVICRRQPG